MSNNNKNWADFWSENRLFAWFIALVVTATLGYLIYNKWGIEVANAKLTPPSDTEENASDLKKETTDEPVSIKSNPIQQNTNSSTKNQSEIPNHSNIDKRQESSISGKIVQENGEPAVNAKVICSNCLTSDSPVFSEQTGRFKINYIIEYKQIEYPVKPIELTVFYQNKTYFASQSISQGSIEIELK